MFKRKTSGEEAREKAYACWIKRGYEWQENCFFTDSGAIAQSYRDGGFKVITDRRAFDRFGNQMTDLVAILAKDKGEK